jgi:3-dehydroquinate synthetase
MGLDRRIEGSRPSRVRVGRGLLRVAPDLGGTLLVADGRVLELYGDLDTGLPRLELVGAESSKSLGELERLLDGLAAAGLDRGSRLVALGGGVTTDLGGLAAALYMRGIDWVALPTTLLAQVDASVGGKTAVNLGAGKNLAGAFHPPSEVLVDPDVLATLAPREVASGLGEVLKAALLGAHTPAERPLLELLEEAPTAALLDPDPDLMVEVVGACVAHKADVVEGDLREAGPRKALNLGHTFAHAIERTAGFGRIPHGVAVTAGLHLALATASRLGLLTEPELPGRLDALTARLGLPGRADPLGDLVRAWGAPLATADLLAAMGLDKKGHAGRPRLVLPRSLGVVELAVEVAPAELERACRRA